MQRTCLRTFLHGKPVVIPHMGETSLVSYRYWYAVYYHRHSLVCQTSVLIHVVPETKIYLPGLADEGFSLSPLTYSVIKMLCFTFSITGTRNGGKGTRPRREYSGLAPQVAIVTIGESETSLFGDSISESIGENGYYEYLLSFSIISHLYTNMSAMLKLSGQGLLPPPSLPNISSTIGYFDNPLFLFWKSPVNLGNLPYKHCNNQEH